jgi:uncharacterized protein YbjT (DUF2867 family)
MTTTDARDPSPPILVTGGTGTLGRLVVRRLADAGRDVRVLSRGTPAAGAIDAPIPGVRHAAGDLATGEGVDAALAGIDVVIHCAGSTKGDELKAQHLVRAARRAGTRHIVNISVVGADRIPVVSAIDRAMFGYFASKLGAERVIAGSGVPWSTLRATQFHDLALKTAQAMARLPIIPVPSGWRFQPIDADEVAARLVELALEEPAGVVAAMGGPRIYPMAELVRGYLRASRKSRLLIPMPVVGGAARAFREGANLAPDQAVGQLTWEEFMATRLGLTRGVHTAEGIAPRG